MSSRYFAVGCAGLGLHGQVKEFVYFSNDLCGGHLSLHSFILTVESFPVEKNDCKFGFIAFEKFISIFLCNCRMTNTMDRNVFIDNFFCYVTVSPVNSTLSHHCPLSVYPFWILQRVPFQIQFPIRMTEHCISILYHLSDVHHRNPDIVLSLEHLLLTTTLYTIIHSNKTNLSPITTQMSTSEHSNVHGFSQTSCSL